MIRTHPPGMQLLYVITHHPHDHEDDEITIYQEDGSVSQNTPTLTKNLSDININTWTLR